MRSSYLVLVSYQRVRGAGSVVLNLWLLAIAFLRFHFSISLPFDRSDKEGFKAPLLPVVCTKHRRIVQERLLIQY